MHDKDLLHPDMWHNPYAERNSAKLDKDEDLRSLLHHQLTNKDPKETNCMYVTYAVINKGNKAIARIIASHGSPDGYCDGHAADIATYPAKDTKALIKEVENHAKRIGTLFAQDEKVTFAPKMNEGVVIMNMPDDATNEKVFISLMANDNKELDNPKQIIINTLGLINFLPPELKKKWEEATEEATIKQEKEANFTIAPIDNSKKKTESNLEKAAKEMALIKKYGKKEMAALAKKMNYKGELINKTKKSHAK